MVENILNSTGTVDVTPNRTFFDVLEYAVRELPHGGHEMEVLSFSMELDGSGEDAVYHYEITVEITS